MEDKYISMPLRMMTWSVIVSIGCYLILIIIGVIAPSKEITPLEVILILLSVAAGLTFYISIGTLAAQIGRSWIIWVGLPIITAPIGPIIAFFWMRNLAKKAKILPTSGVHREGPPVGDPV